MIAFVMYGIGINKKESYIGAGMMSVGTLHTSFSGKKSLNVKIHLNI